MLLRLFVIYPLLIIFCAWPFFGRAHDPNGLTNQMYSQAMVAMQVGDFSLAIDIFEALLHIEPHHAGAWLDLSSVYCQTGNFHLAQDSLNRARRFVEFPTVIEDLMRQQMSNRCSRLRFGHKLTRLSVGSGFDSNANLGPSQLQFSLGPTGQTMQVQLSPDFAPRSDNFLEFKGDTAIFSDPNGLIRLSGMTKQFAHVSNHDQTILNIEAQQLLPEVPLRPFVFLNAGKTWLGGSPLQSSLGTGIAFELPSPAPFVDKLRLDAQATIFRHPRQENYDATITSFRTYGEWFIGRAKKSVLSSDFSWIWDRATNNRPGGNRYGQSIAIGYRHLFRQGEFWSQIRLQRLRDDSLFIPGTIEVKREQSILGFRAGALFPLSDSLSWRVDYQYNRNRDKVRFFGFTNHVFQFSFQWEGVLLN